MMPNTFGCVIACALLVAAPAAAQEDRAWPERIFVAIDVPFLAASHGIAESLSFPDALRRTESVTFAAEYESARGALFDVGGGVRVAKTFGLGVTASWLQQSSGATFDLKVPNPLVANTPLDLAGSVSGLRRRELGIHIQGLYALALGAKGRVTLAGGPSVFRTTQDLVRSIEFDTLPGFTSLAFNQALTAEVGKTAVGFNVGADTTWLLTSHIGVGTVTRYSRAKMALDPGAEGAVRRAIDARAGGLHLGGGIRLLF